MEKESQELSKKKNYHLGIALSGGGSRGFAHLGALAALEEKNIYPDILSGTSAGAVVGAFYSSGFKPLEILDLFMQQEVTDFLSLTFPKEAFFKYDGFQKFLKKHLPVKRIEDLQIPLHIVATDFDEGKCIEFTEGELIPRVMASCTIPIIFNPILIDGVHYVDGGLFKNFPVTPIRPLCDKIIGINVCPYLTDGYEDNLLHIAARSYQYMFKANTVLDTKQCDFLLEVDSIGNYNTFDLKNAYKIYEEGYKQMKDALNQKASLVKTLQYTEQKPG